MKTQMRNRGSVLLMVVFVVAMLTVLIMGMLQINTEEIQIVQNHIRAVETMAIAEAGLNDALAQLRENQSWDAGFDAKPFTNGEYTVTVSGGHITSVSTSKQGFVARVEADVVLDADGPPHIVGIDRFRVNE